jgi:ABC-type branched-subunit amino acid transport system ATPase component
MITEVVIRNFKSCRDVEVKLERFTMFVGPNGSGKTSILKAVYFLCNAFYPEPKEPILGLSRRNIEGSVRQFRSWGSTENVELIAGYGGNHFRMIASERSESTWLDAAFLGLDRVSYAANEGGNWLSWEKLKSRPEPPPFALLLRLEASKLVETKVSPRSYSMAADGTGLHVATMNMTLNEPDAWAKLQFDLRQLIPSIRRIRHTKTDTHNPASLLFDTIGAESLKASEISEGTLLVLGLLTAIYITKDRAVLLLDDLDRGLHPKAQADLIGYLRELLKAKPDLQILATTHSPYMLDSMEAKEVRMTYLRDDGTTACGALTEHPEFQQWKDEMTPGELWSLFGEKWVADTTAHR